MDWIKRNMMFVIGSTVALVLMGLAGFYLYSGMGRNNAALEKLNSEYVELDRLNKLNPHPGNEKVNNIKAAKDQEQVVRTFIGKAEKVFEPIPPVPNSTNLNNAMLAGALRRTMDQMRKAAANGGVEVDTNYCFSFKAEENLIQFDRAGLLPLATQLGEVKAICDVLFDARINALDNIRRVKVAAEDIKSQQTTDYLDRTSVTNEIGVIAPYEVSIRCFSSELGQILSGFASSPHALVVRAINVEPAVLGATAGELGMEGMMAPRYMAQPMPNRRMMGEGENLRNMRTYQPPVAYAPAAPASRGGLPTLLDEKQLKATLLIEVVKLTPKN